MFTIRNTVVVAMMQIGVIVAGVLGAGLCHKAWSGSGLAMLFPAAMLYSYGIMGFCIPLSWAAVALMVLRRPEISDDIKGLAFWSGVGLVIGLVVFVLNADIAPWLSGTWGLSGDGE